MENVCRICPIIRKRASIYTVSLFDDDDGGAGDAAAEGGGGGGGADETEEEGLFLLIISLSFEGALKKMAINLEIDTIQSGKEYCHMHSKDWSIHSLTYDPRISVAHSLIIE